jgi:putative transposase
MGSKRGGVGVTRSSTSYAVWLYYRFNLSHRDIEDLLAERGITVSHEAVRLWYPKHSLRSWGRLCIKFGAKYARRLKRRHQGYGDTFYIDEVFVKINGKQYYLWRAVDQDGEVVDVYLQAKREGAVLTNFLPSFRGKSGPDLVSLVPAADLSVAWNRLLPIRSKRGHVHRPRLQKL